MQKYDRSQRKRTAGFVYNQLSGKFSREDNGLVQKTDCIKSMIAYPNCSMRIKTSLLVAWLLFAAVAARSQEEFVEPPSRFLTRIPFRQLTGGVILFNAQFDTYPDTLNFILDTGSSGISLDSTTAEYFKEKPEPSDKTIRGIAGIKKVSFLYNRRMVLPRLTVDSLNFHVNDYSVLETVYGERIDGIVGYSMLSRYIFKINYDSLFIDICSNGSIRYPKDGFLLKPFISTLPIHNVKVEDETVHDIRILHDIGAGVCLMLTKDFAEDSALLKKKRKLRVKEGAGVGGEILMKITVVKELKLGPYRFHNVPTYIFEDKYNVTSYPFLSGLIGNDILKRFNVIINYAKRDIHLKPNTHYREPFDYSYSGIELHYVDGATTVAGVAPDSPGEKTGLQEGDIIIGVNNNLTQNFAQYKQALQEPNKKVKLIISRNGGLMEKQLKISSILKR